MRIIGGDLAGRRLVAPPGLDTRPLPDRIKQSLFDRLGQRLDGWRVADVCAGSGAFACEAFSRGAAEIHLIEPGRHAWPAIEANLRGCGSPSALVLHRCGFAEALPRLTGLDLVFCDPPFPWFSGQPADLAELLRLAVAALAAEGRILLRGERGQDPPLIPQAAWRDRWHFGRSWVAVLVPAPT